MKESYNGWKDRADVYIPKIQKEGFTDPVIIRKPVKPICIQRPEEYTGDDPTVLLYPEMKISAYIKRLKTGEKMDLPKNGFVIGKSAEADFVVKDNPTISRKHARIIYGEDGYWLEDMGSANHTYFAGEQLTGKMKLENHIVFRLSGDEEFEFTVKVGH